MIARFCIIGFFYLLISALAISPCFAFDEKRIDLLLEEDELCVLEDSFTAMEGSAIFCDKFALNENEQAMVGLWNNSALNQSAIDESNDGMGMDVGFLPNRIFVASKNIQTYVKKGEDLVLKDDKIRDLVGEWKIVDGILYLRFEKAYFRDACAQASIDDTPHVLPTEYYPVWKMAMHRRAAFQASCFYFSRLPQYVRDFYNIASKDYIRSRLPVPLLFGTSWNVIDRGFFKPNRPWCNFLLTPNLLSDRYNTNLRIMSRNSGALSNPNTANIGSIEF